MLDYIDQSGKRRQISLGHADQRKAELQRYQKQLELRMNVAEPISMRLTDFFQDSLLRTKGQVRATTLKETAGAMRNFVERVGDINVQEVRYEHGERFIQYCLDREVPAATVTKKVKHQMSLPERCPCIFVLMARYERIRELRRAGQWTVEKGRLPLSKFCHHFNKIRDLAGIRTGTFHDLRRTCLGNWIIQGLSLHEVKELAGHAGIKTTDRFYLAVRKDVVDRARTTSEASRKGQSVACLL